MVSVRIHTIDDNHDRWLSLQVVPRVGETVILFEREYRVAKVVHHLPQAHVMLVLEIV